MHPIPSLLLPHAGSLTESMSGGQLRGTSARRSDQPDVLPRASEKHSSPLQAVVAATCSSAVEEHQGDI